MTDLDQRITQVRDKIQAALDLTSADNQSPVALAVVREFANKGAKAAANPNRDAVIELEQAGDSAKAAAEADPNLSDGAKQAILDAHLSICILKGKVTKED